MTRLLFASLLAAAVVFAQTGGGTTGKPKTEASETPKVASGKKATKERKAAGKKATKEKGKKGSTGTTTPPPK